MRERVLSIDEERWDQCMGSACAHMDDPAECWCEMCVGAQLASFYFPFASGQWDSKSDYVQNVDFETGFIEFGRRTGISSGEVSMLFNKAGACSREYLTLQGFGAGGGRDWLNTREFVWDNLESGRFDGPPDTWEWWDAGETA